MVKEKQSYVSIIHDAKKNSVRWHHEMRHCWQQKYFKAVVLYGMWCEFALASCFMLALLTKFYGYAFNDLIYGILLIWIVFNAILEVDAHFYAIRKTSFRRWLNETTYI